MSTAVWSFIVLWKKPTAAATTSKSRRSSACYMRTFMSREVDGRHRVKPARCGCAPCKHPRLVFLFGRCCMFMGWLGIERSNPAEECHLHSFNPTSLNSLELPWVEGAGWALDGDGASGSRRCHRLRATPSSAVCRVSEGATTDRQNGVWKNSLRDFLDSLNDTK